jgi:hypothetical protein
VVRHGIEVIAHIRKNETGEVRRYADEWEEGGAYLFQWTEGNYGCDCNRAIFFERVAGNELEWDEPPCGEGRYSVNLERGGEIVHREFGESNGKDQGRG